MTKDPWNLLLSTHRYGRNDSRNHLDARSEFDRDHDRIVFSSAFRRLKDKTQVFPLSKNDFTRTRLTHSIEVSCVGRSLGTSLESARLGTTTKRKLILPSLTPVLTLWVSPNAPFSQARENQCKTEKPTFPNRRAEQYWTCPRFASVCWPIAPVVTELAEANPRPAIF